MLSRFRHVFAVVFFLLIASCSGGGCSGCTGCAGSTPLPGGFPTDQAVENAASVRVSRPGLDFVEKSLPATVTKLANATNGKIGFDIPKTDPPPAQIADLSIFGKVYLDALVCKNGADPSSTPPRCHAEIGIGSSTFAIDAVTPHAVKLRATIPVKLDDTDIEANVSYDPPFLDPANLGGMTIHVGYGDGGCTDGKPKVTAHALPIGVTIPLVEETTAPRTGYTKIDVENAQIDLSGISENDVQVCSSCGFASAICSAITNSGFVKGLVIDPIKNALQSQVKGMLRDQLCTAPTPTLNPPCPTGSKPDAANKHCVYTSAPDKCVPMLLGTDAHVDLGGFLRSISPNTSGGLDFGLAAGGDMNPAPGAAANAQGRTPNGITLGMVGGVLPQPPSKCVPQAPVTVPTGIPVPDELAPKTPDTATAPHVGIALSGRFLDYSMTSVYNSGLLCLGVSTEQFDMLKSGLLSLLVPSLKTLTFDRADAAAAIATRPQKPPTVKVGGGTNPDTDPLLLITAPSFAIDFYIWSYDRFARVFTFTSDLTIPVNLQTGKDPVKNPNGGIIPAIGAIKAVNGKVTNAELLLDNPDVVGGALQGLLGSVSKQLVGSGFSPVDLSSALSSLGLSLEINDIKKLTKGTDDFVGIFATMAKAKTTATAESDTTAKLLSKKVDKEHMQLSTYSKETLPELALDLGSSLDDGKRAIEYSWWIDNGTRSPWSTEKHLVIKDEQLFMQGKHVLRVVSRIAGEPVSEDATPAEVPFTIDALAPFIKVEKDGAKAKVTTWDLVSADDALVARYRLDDKPFGEWRPAAEIANLDVGDASEIEIEVKDEEGNIGTSRQALRGVADPTLAASGSGCGCSTPGLAASTNTKKDMNGILALCLALGGLSFIVLRRRRGSRAAAPVAALVTTLAVASTSQGCACGDSEDPGTGCGADCNQECKTGMLKGQPGAYLSVAKAGPAGDNAIWAAGYNDGSFSEGDSYLYGDLVVGKYDLGKQAVDWETVDGLPSRTDGTCPEYEPGGWRKGELDSGDNVGRWASIQVSNGGKPMVSYYDDTANRLKFAINDGGWKTFVLKEAPKADIGRYSKMVLGADGKPVVMFMVVEPGNGGHSRSKVVVARAKVEEPHEAGDFTFEDAAVDEDSPCRADTCSGGEKCVKATGVCTKTVTGCTPADCGAGKACVMQDNKATCATLVSEIETYPRALGAYISLAVGPKGLGAVFYDGFHGNLVALSDAGGGKWTRTILDGETGLRSDKTARDTGDVGIAASLAIAPTGIWHVSYVNGIDETLRYITATDNKPGKSEVIDDGSSVDGKAFPDGKHLVGDDSAIRVDGDVVTVYYTDSSSLGVRKAVGTTQGGSRKWDLRTVPLQKTWVLFPAFVPGDSKALAFWRQTTRSNKTVEGDVIMLP